MNHFCISGVGKTSLVRRYTENKWNPAGTASTTGAFFVTHKTDFKGTRVKLQIWDTAGTCFALPRIRIVAMALLRSVVLPVWGVSPHDLDGLLVLGSPRLARLLAHCLALTPSGSLPDLRVGRSISVCSRDRGFTRSIRPTLSQDMPRVSLEAGFPIVSLQATIGI